MGVRVPKKVLRAAVALYQAFREKKPKRIRVVDFDIPTAVVAIGYVDEICYTTSHGDKPVAYTHSFAPGSRPLLVSSADGRQLLLLGGRYKFDDRGIVDKDSRGRDIINPRHGDDA